MNYKDKYIKYKTKYLELKHNQNGGKKKYNDDDDWPISYRLELSEPWFTLVSLDLKIVEGMINTGKFKEIKSGDIIEWYNNDFNIKRTILTEVVGKKEYKTFEDFLLAERLVNTLPGIETVKDGVSVYHTYYKKKDENKHGVIGIRLDLIK